VTRRPTIGVTGPRRGAWGPRVCVHVGLRLAGARARHLRPGRPVDLTDLDGVVVTGGHDVDPTLYSEVSEVQGRYDPERDAFESRVIELALVRDLPVLGICRGAQLLNVWLGGSLTQDLTIVRQNTSNRRTLLPLKTLVVEPGSRLGAWMGIARGRVNSLHRQGIARVGSGLRVTGRDLDGIVQAVEHEEFGHVVGVQWHPEFLLYLGAQRRLFAALVRAARHEIAAEVA